MAAYNDVNDGDILDEADWDSIGTHDHGGGAREGASIDFSANTHDHEDAAGGGTDVHNVLGKTISSLIPLMWNSQYSGKETNLNYPLTDFYFKDCSSDILTSDTATTSTNWTYSASADCYETDEGSNTATLEFTNTTNSNIGNSISVIGGQYELTDTAMTNAYFEDVISGEWVYSELDTNGRFTDTGRSTDMNGGETSGTYSYKFSITSGETASLDYVQIAQTGVDLTNSDWIQVDYANTDAGDNYNGYFHIIIDSTTVASTEEINLTNAHTGTTFGALIPEVLRTTNKTITLKWIKSGIQSAGGSFAIWFDSVRIYTKKASEADNSVTYSVSYDGSDYQTITDGEIDINTNTGTDLRLKTVVVHTTNTYAKDTISEKATRYDIL